MTSELHLEKITEDNFAAAIGIKVHPEQEFAVAPVVRSLAEAYVHPDIAWPRLIVDGDRPVGFLMAFLNADFKGDGIDFRSGLWRLNIAADQQGNGYGRFAVDAVAAEIRRRGGTRLTVTWQPGENGPEGFYLRLGFKPTGETFHDETVAELELS